MFGKKCMIILMGILVVGMSFEMYSMPGSDRQPSKSNALVSRFDGLDLSRESALPEKPRFLQQGVYKHGRYTQFTVDTQGLAYAAVAGITARTLVSLAQCGNKFENFKSSVLRPGCIKSALFWVPSIVAYRFVLSSKNNAELLGRLKQYEGEDNPASRFFKDDRLS